uniref:Uncharacterized protein n=1 Tax=Panagrolaimus sp. JU765 TaxID=591449 RepID=A0AC34QKR9_9BILA
MILPPHSSLICQTNQKSMFCSSLPSCLGPLAYFDGFLGNFHCSGKWFSETPRMSHERAFSPLNQTPDLCQQQRFQLFARKSEIREESTCPHFHLPDSVEINIRAIRGDAARKYGVDYYFHGGDCLLIGRDGKKILVCLLQAAAVSPFLSVALLSNAFTEAKSKTVRLPNFSSTEVVDAFELNNWVIFQWLKEHKKMTVGSLRLDCAFNIMKVAAFFQMEHLMEVLTDYIVEKSEGRRLIRDYHDSKGLSAKLAHGLWKKILRTFTTLVDTGNYFELTDDEFLECIEDRQVNLLWTRDEDAIYQFMKNKRWYLTDEKKHLTSRHSKLKEYLVSGRTGAYGSHGKARVPQSAIIAQGGWGENGPTTMVEIYDYHTEQWLQPKASASNLIEHPRAYHGLLATDHGLMVMGGFNGRTYYRTVSVFCKDSLEWKDCCTTVEPRCYVSMGILDRDTVLACGGYTGQMRLRTAEIYNFAENQWLKTSSMNTIRSDSRAVSFPNKNRVYMDCCTTVEPRCYVSMGILDRDTVLACGGYTGQMRLRTAEIYNFAENQWLKTSSMNTIRSDSRAVSFPNKNRVYMVGGFDGRLCHKTVEYYVPEEDKWIAEKAQMAVKRSGVGAVALDDSLLIAIGGFNGTSRLSSAEMLDIREGIWHEIGSLNTSRSNFGTAVLNNVPFVFGGYNQERTIKNVERYEMRMNQWIEMPSMGITRSALASCVVEDVDFIDRIIDRGDNVLIGHARTMNSNY